MIAYHKYLTVLFISFSSLVLTKKKRRRRREEEKK
jgi:hypothetical protein